MRWLGDNLDVVEYEPTVEFDNRHAPESHGERLERIAAEATEKLSRERPGGEHDV